MTVRADLLWPRHHPLCVAWIGPGGGLFVLPADDGGFWLAEGHNWRVTQMLAVALNLGPRPRSEEEVTLVTTTERLHALLDLGATADAVSVLSALQLESLRADDADALSALAVACPAHWRIEVAWGTQRRRLHALDREEWPLWVLGEWTGETLVGGPSTPTTLWRGVSAMLPTDQDLEEALATRP